MRMEFAEMVGGNDIAVRAAVAVAEAMPAALLPAATV
jgi:hypothetical protein